MITDERLAELIEKLDADCKVKWHEDSCMTVDDDEDAAAGLRELQRTRQITYLCLEILPSLERWHDCGPENEGWQSDELMALIEALNAKAD